jgi:hypothetical protein
MSSNLDGCVGTSNSTSIVFERLLFHSQHVIRQVSVTGRQRSGLRTVFCLGLNTGLVDDLNHASHKKAKEKHRHG